MNSDNSPNDLRNLWQSQATDAFSMSVEELRKAANKFTRDIFWRNSREYAAAVFVVGAYGYYIYRFHNVFMRLGSALIIAAAIWVSYWIRKKGSPRAMKAEMDAQSCIDFHRSELVRQRDLLSTVWRWYLLPFTPGLALFILGQQLSALAKTGLPMHYGQFAIRYGVVVAVFAGSFTLLGKFNQWAARKVQRKIDALDKMRPPSG
jgi:hypothetical protein